MQTSQTKASVPLTPELLATLGAEETRFWTDFFHRSEMEIVRMQKQGVPSPWPVSREFQKKYEEAVRREGRKFFRFRLLEEYFVFLPPKTN